MDNLEYANATTEQLDAWEMARFEAEAELAAAEANHAFEAPYIARCAAYGYAF